MNNYSTRTKFFLVTSSFAGGLALGLLFSPGTEKKNRTLLRKRARSLAQWIEQQSSETLDLSTKRLRGIRKQIQKGIDHNVPDLYRATEQLHLDEDDFPHV